MAMNLEQLREHILQFIGVKGVGKASSPEDAELAETVLTNCHAELERLNLAPWALSAVPTYAIEGLTIYTAPSLAGFHNKTEQFPIEGKLNGIRLLRYGRFEAVRAIIRNNLWGEANPGALAADELIAETIADDAYGELARLEAVCFDIDAAPEYARQPFLEYATILLAAYFSLETDYPPERKSPPLVMLRRSRFEAVRKVMRNILSSISNAGQEADDVTMAENVLDTVQGELDQYGAGLWSVTACPLYAVEPMMNYAVPVLAAYFGLEAEYPLTGKAIGLRQLRELTADPRTSTGTACYF